MINKEILKDLEKRLSDNILTYEDYIKILKEDKINSFFEDVLYDRAIVPQEEIDNLSKVDNVNELYSIYLEINDVVINNDYDDNNKFTDDILKQYLQEISRFPLLSYKEERDVLKKFGYHLKELRENKNIDDRNGMKQYLTNEEQQAYDYFINCNYRLVVSVAKKYKEKGLDFLDLIQYGNIGLMKALDRFDIDAGYKFSTYANWWIKQYIGRGLADTGKAIRLPVHLVEFFNRINNISKKIYTEKGYWPSNRELAINYLNLNPDDISEEDKEKINMVVDKIKNNVYVTQDTVSLNVKYGEDEDTTLENVIADDGDTLETSVMKKLLQEDIDKILASEDIKLDERSIKVLALRFGLYDGKRRTLEEVGKVFGVTRERIRQIEFRALKKLRKNKALASYVDEFVPCKKKIEDYTLRKSK